jgi:hypothetical protein
MSAVLLHSSFERDSTVFEPQLFQVISEPVFSESVMKTPAARALHCFTASLITDLLPKKSRNPKAPALDPNNSS